MNKFVILLRLLSNGEDRVPMLWTFHVEEGGHIHKHKIDSIMKEYVTNLSAHEASTPAGAEHLRWLCNQLLQTVPDAVVRIDAIVPGLEEYAIPDAKKIRIYDS